MCSLGAVFDKREKSDILKTLYKIGTSQINRGTESYGFSLYSQNKIFVEKEREMNDAYWNMVRKKLNAHAGTVHTRYSTSGISDLEYAQPFHVKDNIDMVLNHNGTIVNSKELKKKHNINEFCRTDTEVITRIIAEQKDVPDGIEKIIEEGIGAYNLIILDSEGSVYSFRDPLGFHPLWYNDGEYFTSMSEDFASYAIGEFNPREVKPGQLLKMSEDGLEKIDLNPGIKKKECYFESIYFEKPGSTHRGRPIKKIRYELGKILGEKEKLKGDDLVVVPVLESGRYYGEGFSSASGIEMKEGLMKNRYERVYMDPWERSDDEYKFSREELSELKHVSMPYDVKGKRVIAIDDSIVRSKTSKAITHSLRKAGAKEVHWRIASPPIRYGCIYGLDHYIRKNLVAAPFEKNIGEKVAKKIGADSVEYMELEDLKKCLNCKGDHCYACITGEYPTEVPEEAYSAIEI